MINYDGWEREYEQNKRLYLALFDQVMLEGNYENVDLFEEAFSQYINRKHIVAVNNATEALRFSLLALGIKPGDEVLVTDFSWISTSSCISMVGATPVFCDIDPNTYHISLESIKRMSSDKTKALIYTHLFGNMTDCSQVLDFCQERGIAFIEDSAQAFGSSLNGVQAGTLGDCSSFSFNSNKVIAGINGGGVFMTDNEELASKVRLLRKHGKQQDFSLLGYNSKMYALNSQIILFRLKNWKVYQEKRQQIANTYNEAFKNLPVRFQRCPAGLNNNRHKYTLQLLDKSTRKKVKRALSASIHYEKPLSNNSMYKTIPFCKDDCINSQQVADTILSLPIHPWLKEEEIKQICKTVTLALD
jgi:dTDP-4-amino-4,6-dideoxygalactose transaminase